MPGRKLVSADTAFVRRRKITSFWSRQSCDWTHDVQAKTQRLYLVLTVTWLALKGPFCSCCFLGVKPNNTTCHLFDLGQSCKGAGRFGSKASPPPGQWLSHEGLGSSLWPASRTTLCLPGDKATKPWRHSWHLLKCNLRCMSALIKWKLYRRRFGPWLF